MGFFPIDEETSLYLRGTGRSEEHVKLYEAYYKAQELWGVPQKGQIDYSVDVELDLSTVVPSVAGPKRPQDRIELPKLKDSFVSAFSRSVAESGFGKKAEDYAQRTAVKLSNGGSGGGSQDPVNTNKAAACETNVATEGEMANNRPTPDVVPPVTAEIGNGSVLI